MTRSVTTRPAALIAACILVSAVTGMLLGRVAISGAVDNTGERPTVTTITPYRVLDTRGAPYGPIGTTGTAPVTIAPVGQGQTLTLQIGGTGVAPDNVPTDATGVVINTTAVNCTADTFITLYPNGAPRPNASQLNPFPGRITHNSAVVDLPLNGRIDIYNNAGSCDVAMDVTGYTVDHGHDDRLGAGSDAVTMTGFEVTLTTDGEEATIIENGPMRLFARCLVNQGGADTVEIIGVSTEDWLDGSDGPITANTEAILETSTGPTGTPSHDNGDVTTAGMVDASGRFIGVGGESIVLATNTFGATCYARGIVEWLPNVR